MARYIDADNFRKTMIKRFGGIPCLTDYSEASRYDIPLDDALDLAPTADVVPKSESLPLDVHEALKQRAVEKAKANVAREIFAEIEDVLNNIGYFDEIDFKSLKKKYTEGE